MHLSFPDSHRRQRVSGDTWRVQLLPLQARRRASPLRPPAAARNAHTAPHRRAPQFLWLTLRVSCTLRAWPDAPGALAVAGREMRVDGLPPELGAPLPRAGPPAAASHSPPRRSAAGMANSIALRVDGGLRSSRALAKDLKAAAGAAPAATALQGRVSLRISADIPPIIALTPGLDAVVGSILEAILGRLEAALRRGLLDDYDAWVREQKAAQHAVLAAAAAAKRETQP